MSDARSIADARLAKGEITQEEHARLVAALQPEKPQPPSDTSGDGKLGAQRTDINLAWMWLAGGIGTSLAVKVAVDKLIANGDPVKWWLVYTIYAVCACVAFLGFGGVIGSKKE